MWAIFPGYFKKELRGHGPSGSSGSAPIFPYTAMITGHCRVEPTLRVAPAGPGFAEDTWTTPEL